MTCSTRKGCTVLVAEDEDAVRLLAVTAIRAQGFEVLSASDAEEAYQCWESHADEIVLFFTDIVMPGRMSGFDVARRIRAERPALPVIFASGYSRETLDGGAELHEGTNYLSKPYRPSDLAAMIATMLAACRPKPEPADRLQQCIEAAGRGDAGAQCDLGLMYATGDGVAANPGKATEWMRKAAEQGHAAAQFRLGQAYEQGGGVVRDERKAAWWYRRAAEQGYTPARASLQRMIGASSGANIGAS